MTRAEEIRERAIAEAVEAGATREWAEATWARMNVAVAVQATGNVTPEGGEVERETKCPGCGQWEVHTLTLEPDAGRMRTGWTACSECGESFFHNVRVKAEEAG